MRGASVVLVVAAVLAGCLQAPAAAPDSPDDASIGDDSVPPQSQGSSSTTSTHAKSSTTSTSTAPKPKDTDKDGISDKAEKENGTDPKDPEDTPYVLPGIPPVDAGALLADLRSFAAAFNDRSGNTADHKAARDWIATRFANAGLEVWRQPFDTGGLAQENVVGIRWGLDTTSWVIVGGHFDTTTTLGVDKSQSQGIYDDGSGTMMSVHLALAYANLTLPYTLAFVAFDGEERGLEGSQAFAAAMLTGESPYPDARMVGAVDIDMFGLNWPGTGAPMVFITNSADLQAAVEAARIAQAVPDEGITYDTGIALGTSDYGTFFEHEVPTGFFMSDFEQLGAPYGYPVATPQGSYPFWHLADTWDTMVLMAGDEAHLTLGFQAGADLAAALVHYVASTPGPVEAGTSAI